MRTPSQLDVVTSKFDKAEPECFGHHLALTVHNLATRATDLYCCLSVLHDVVIVCHGSPHRHHCSRLPNLPTTSTQSSLHPWRFRPSPHPDLRRPRADPPFQAYHRRDGNLHPVTVRSLLCTMVLHGFPSPLAGKACSRPRRSTPQPQVLASAAPPNRPNQLRGICALPEGRRGSSHCTGRR